MVKVEDKAFINPVYFPKTVSIEKESYTLTLQSELMQKTYTFTGLTDESKSKNYYKFTVDFSQVDSAEYNYNISDISTGLIRIGQIEDNVPEQVNYNPAEVENEIIQYYPTGNYKYRFQNNKVIYVESNGTINIKPDSGYTALLNAEVHVDVPSSGQTINNQIKSLEITEPVYISTITYDEGYTGLESVGLHVEVDTQPYWNSGYNSGWTDGYAAASGGGGVENFVVSINPSSSESGESLENLITVTITCSGVSESILYQGSPIVRSFTPGLEYSIEFSRLQHYIKPQTITGITLWDEYQEYDVEYRKINPFQEQYLTVVMHEDGSITKDYDVAFEVSVNGGEWESLEEIEVVSGDVINFRGDNVSRDDDNPAIQVAGEFHVEGNIMSCYDSENFVERETITDNGVFSYYFKNNTGLTSAENLIFPATALTVECYCNMFEGCENLVTAPSELPATVLGDNCYGSMFERCYNLVTAPSILPATNLEVDCYQAMFSSCFSLTTAPELPATTLAGYCYWSMFNSCHSLNFVKCLAVDGIEDATGGNFISSRVEDGTFVKNPELTDIPEGFIPDGWTVIDAE